MKHFTLLICVLLYCLPCDGQYIEMTPYDIKADQNELENLMTELKMRPLDFNCKIEQCPELLYSSAHNVYSISKPGEAQDSELKLPRRVMKKIQSKSDVVTIVRDGKICIYNIEKKKKKCFPLNNGKKKDSDKQERKDKNNSKAKSAVVPTSSANSSIPRDIIDSELESSRYSNHKFDGHELTNDKILELFPKKKQSIIAWDYVKIKKGNVITLNVKGQIRLLTTTWTKNKYWDMIVSEKKCENGNGCFRGYTVLAKEIITADIIADGYEVTTNISGTYKINKDYLLDEPEAIQSLDSGNEELVSIYTTELELVDHSTHNSFDMRIYDMDSNQIFHNGQSQYANSGTGLGYYGVTLDDCSGIEDAYMSVVNASRNIAEDLSEAIFDASEEFLGLSIPLAIAAYATKKGGKKVGGVVTAGLVAAKPLTDIIASGLVYPSRLSQDANYFVHDNLITPLSVAAIGTICGIVLPKLPDLNAKLDMSAVGGKYYVAYCAIGITAETSTATTTTTVDDGEEIEEVTVSGGGGKVIYAWCLVPYE